MVYRESLKLQSRDRAVSFHDVTQQVKEIAAKSGMKDGICVVYSHHTTCSVITQECAFDMSMTGLETLQQDLVNVFEEWIPTCRYEGMYLHPGRKALDFAESVGEDNFGCHNTDAHLRSSFFGRSETMTVKDGVLDGGEFAHVYFIDWDQVRARRRQLNVTVMGTTEDVEDRKWNGGEVINTLHRFTDEEKAYDPHYDLQLKR